MKKIGLTGGFGSGKSTVTGMLRALGIRVIDADRIARTILKPGTEGERRIKRIFGGFFRADGSLDRRRLARRVFRNRSALEKLNKATHPLILQAINKKTRGYKNCPFVVIDAALLIETGLYREMNKLIVVWAPKETCIRRLVRHRDFRRCEAEERIRAQLPLRQKRGHADYVIDNSGSKAKTRREVKNLVRKLPTFYLTP